MLVSESDYVHKGVIHTGLCGPCSWRAVSLIRGLQSGDDYFVVSLRSLQMIKLRGEDVFDISTRLAHHETVLRDFNGEVVVKWTHYLPQSVAGYLESIDHLKAAFIHPIARLNITFTADEPLFIFTPGVTTYGCLESSIIDRAISKGRLQSMDDVKKIIASVHHVYGGKGLVEWPAAELYECNDWNWIVKHPFSVAMLQKEQLAIGNEIDAADQLVSERNRTCIKAVIDYCSKQQELLERHAVAWDKWQLLFSNRPQDFFLNAVKLELHAESRPAARMMHLCRALPNDSEELAGLKAAFRELLGSQVWRDFATAAKMLDSLIRLNEEPVQSPYHLMNHYQVWEEYLAC